MLGLCGLVSSPRTRKIRGNVKYVERVPSFGIGPHYRGPIATKSRLPEGRLTPALTQLARTVEPWASPPRMA